jgi:predicted nucleic acid-binding protein
MRQQIIIIVVCTAVAMEPVSRQRIDKHLPAVTNTHKIVELFLETVLSTRSVQSVYKKDSWGDPVIYSVWRQDRISPP